TAGAEESVSAARGRILAECGVGIEHLEIVERRTLEAALLRDRIDVRRAKKYLLEAELNLAGKIRDHAAHVMADDLERRQLIEDAGIDKPRHAGRCLVRPSEAEPDLVRRRRLAGIVGELRSPHRMHEDRQIVLRHFLEYRPELGRAQRL